VFDKSAPAPARLTSWSLEGADWGLAPGRCASGVRAKGWDALSLAAKELTRLFPSLWETRKAAEHWTAKNSPEAYNNIIRVWGVLNNYRPNGQRSWSKALVRHGSEARLALAAALGVPAEAIRVRESAGGPVPLGARPLCFAAAATFTNLSVTVDLPDSAVRQVVLGYPTWWCHAWTQGSASTSRPSSEASTEIASASTTQPAQSAIWHSGPAFRRSRSRVTNVG
jgi:hypothetical protein